MRMSTDYSKLHAGIYAVKIKQIPLPREKEACSSMLIVGDLSSRVVDQLATLVDNVFAPLLRKPENHKDLPDVAVQDICRHVHALRGTLYQVKGQVNGRTVLPMPAGMEKVAEVEKMVRAEGPQAADLYLKSAIEGVVIKWAYLVNDVVTQESGAAFENNQNPTPDVELDYWAARLANLRYIYDQLQEDRVKKMASILERTESAYYPCFRTLFENVVSSMAEAKEISLYLSPLSRCFKAVEEVDFAEAKPLMATLIHSVGLAWSKSSHYQSSSKVIIMLRQICNLLIQEARRFLDPSSIFQSDVDEALQRVQISRGVLEEFRRQFELRKDMPAMKPHAPPWTFNSSAVFGRLDAFLKRLADIEWLFNTVMEFSKLEKIEIGGILGRSLSSRIINVYKEFQQLFVSFTVRANDALEPDDESFTVDCQKFNEAITDLDSKLAAILCQAFDDCGNLESVFKVLAQCKIKEGRPEVSLQHRRRSTCSYSPPLINIAGSVLDRPVISKQFTDRYTRILDLLNVELTVVEVLFNRGTRGALINLPPLAAALTFTSMLRQRIDLPVQSFKAIQHPMVTSEEGQSIERRYARLIRIFSEKEDELFTEWARTVPETVDIGLNRNILTREKDSTLLLNFDQELLAVLKEVNYLKQMSRTDIPDEAVKVSEDVETFRKFRTLLGATVNSYNSVRKTTTRVEFHLIENEIARIDSLVSRGENELCWRSAGVLEYIVELGELVEGLWRRIKSAQTNVGKIKAILEPWTRTPLIERKDRRRDALLLFEEQLEKVSRRYGEIEKAAEQIHSLVKENRTLFQVCDEIEEPWRRYVEYVDDIVVESLRRALGCSLGFYLCLSLSR
ncbi:dynein beta chain, ciliary-like [Halictus rubicundus]|uniref:dynein beta chain, ciliary-like n=1 Tax=Halictus rubicundus TaxID=77578 RepID=UPI004036FBB5